MDFELPAVEVAFNKSIGDVSIAEIVSLHTSINSGAENARNGKCKENVSFLQGMENAFCISCIFTLPTLTNR